MSKVFYHVAPADYRIGDDLMSYDLLEERGYAPTWKWEDAEVGFDTDVVCLFERLDDAQAFVADFLPDGQILRVDLTDAPNVRLTRVDEGFPAALRRIPAEYITVVA